MNEIKPPIKLQEGEELKLVIKRSRMSLAAIWAVETIIIAAIITGFIFLGTGMDDTGMLAFLLVLLLVGAVGSGLIGTYLNFKNKLFVTNRRLIYQKVENILNNRIKTIELRKIESNSFSRVGVAAHLLGYGTLKFATMSDETTYVFPYCDAPKSEIAKVLELIEKSKREFQGQHQEQPSPTNEEQPEETTSQ